jgi:hypothetical protein
MPYFNFMPEGCFFPKEAAEADGAAGIFFLASGIGFGLTGSSGFALACKSMTIFFLQAEHVTENFLPNGSFSSGILYAFWQTGHSIFIVLVDSLS